MLFVAACEYRQARCGCGYQVERSFGNWQDEADRFVFFDISGLELKSVDFDDDLDTVHVQEELRECLVVAPLERQTTLLEGRPSLTQLFDDIAERVVNRTVVDVESLVDVLTLKDNFGTSGMDPAIALDRLAKDIVSVIFVS